MMVWAFNAAEDDSDRREVYRSVKEFGKSRFGWSHFEENNLKLDNNWTEDHPAQLFLLQIKRGDWIVHINTPKKDMCIAAKVLSGYDFDEGIDCRDRRDFRHYFVVDVKSIVEFNRKNPNVLPTVNLYPRRRYHRVRAIDDFEESIENLRNRAISLGDGESREEYHLRNKVNDQLPALSNLIHDMHRSKDLEKFFAKVFRRITGVVDVTENGSRWGTDYGADLIVTMGTHLGMGIEIKIVVQV